MAITSSKVSERPYCSLLRRRVSFMNFGKSFDFGVERDIFRSDSKISLAAWKISKSYQIHKTDIEVTSTLGKMQLFHLQCKQLRDYLMSIYCSSQVEEILIKDHCNRYD